MLHFPPVLFSSHLNFSSSLVENGLTQFQNSNLLDQDKEQHIAPCEAQEPPGDCEVQRQNMLSEVVKSERDYVHDNQRVCFSSLALIVLIKVHIHPATTRCQPPCPQTQ